MIPFYPTKRPEMDFSQRNFHFLPVCFLRILLLHCIKKYIYTKACAAFCFIITTLFFVVNKPAGKLPLKQGFLAVFHYWLTCGALCLFTAAAALCPGTAPLHTTKSPQPEFTNIPFL